MSAESVPVGDVHEFVARRHTVMTPLGPIWQAHSWRRTEVT